ncbi:MAG: ligase-associated DNA damage response endonuclease PdeM [Candidatus Omnitrophica bacterium]|nr:ligase-associated DNA damage response endonuclease PdeM [Candidatus Omnitrophota bacterium]
MLRIEWCGNHFRLLPERAALWEERSIFLIADPHFGKEDSFRANGIAIPAGGLKQDLDRLGKVIHRERPSGLMILGDFFHTKKSQSDETLSLLRGWRNDFGHIDITLLRGNHDIHSGCPPKDLGIVDAGDSLEIGSFQLRHEATPDEKIPTICGHIHPVVKLIDPTGVKMRLPCFWQSSNRLVLPSFGGFTGGFETSPVGNDRVYVIGEGEVIEIL